MAGRLMLAWFQVAAFVATLGWAIHAERKAADATRAAHEAGLYALRSRQAADDSERAAYGTVRRVG